jgi:hypothetical protein
MQANDQGTVVGFDYQRPHVTGITVRIEPQPTPQKLSHTAVAQIKKAVKQIKKQQQK